MSLDSPRETHTSTATTKPPSPCQTCISGHEKKAACACVCRRMDYLETSLPHSRDWHGFSGKCKVKILKFSQFTWCPSEALHSAVLAQKQPQNTTHGSCHIPVKFLFRETDLAHRCADPYSVVISSVTHTSRGLVVLPSSEIEQHGNYFTLKYLNLYKFTYRLYLKCLWKKKKIQNLVS